MAINDGGPAFPRPDVTWSDAERLTGTQGHPGMSLRDWFAGQALAGGTVFFGDDWADRSVWDSELIAKQAYMIADAMLAERESDQ